MNFKFLNGGFLLREEAEGTDSVSSGVDSYSTEHLESLAAEVETELGTGKSDQDLIGEKVLLGDEGGHTEEKEKSNDDVIAKFLSDNAAEKGQAENDAEEPSETESEEVNWLTDVNSLGFTNDGESFEVQSPEHLKELVQKGFNYTQKTQTLAEERKTAEAELETQKTAFDTERKEFDEMKVQFNDTLQENKDFEAVLNILKAEDPDTLEYIAQKYQQVVAMRPAQQSEDPRFQLMEQQLAELKQSRQVDQAAIAQKEFDLEYKENTTLIGELKDQLGLDVDKQKIMDRWLNGETLTKAIFAEYGDKIYKLQASKNKVAKSKVAATRKKTASGASARKQVTNTNKLDKSKSYASLANELANLID